MSDHRTKYVFEGQYVGVVDVERIDVSSGWPPYLSLADAQKLDDVRDALRRGDLKTAAQMARVYELTPVAV